MKIIVIALLVFFLNLSVSMVDLLGIYQFNIVQSGQWNADIDEVKAEQYNPDIAADVATSFGFGDFVTGFRLFRDVIFRAVNISATIRLFDSNNEWGAIPTFFGLGVTLLYIIGLAQFISNRSTKGMQ